MTLASKRERERERVAVVKRLRKLGYDKKDYTWDFFSKALPVFFLAFLTTFLASSIFLPINPSNAVETLVSANVVGTDYELSLSVDSQVNLDIETTPTGSMTVASSPVSVSTTSPNGYKLYLAMKGTSQNLIHTVDATKSLAGSGTFTQPTALTNTGTWGYAIPSGTANIKPNGFDDNYATMSSQSIATTATFAVPPLSSAAPQLVTETEHANTSTDTFNVFYGAAADNTVPAGTYQNSVVWTAVAEAAGGGGTMTVAPTTTPTLVGGDKVTISTSLYATSLDVPYTVYLLTDAQKSAVDGGAAVASNNSGTFTCTRDDNASYLKLNCTNPAAPIGDYYAYVDVPNYGVHYAAEYDYVATFYNISKMQQMTADVCDTARTPLASTYTSYTGNNTTPDDGYPGADVIAKTGTLDYNYADTGATNDSGQKTGYPKYTESTTNYQRYVPQTVLTDERDQNTYVVRKLADGNCWMTDNLNLKFAQGTGGNSTLVPGTSNVTTNVTIDNTGKTWNSGISGGGTITGSVANAMTQPETADDNAKLWASGSSPKAEQIDRWLSRQTSNKTESQLGGDLTGEDQVIGVYYNWYTAVAGSRGYDDGAGEASMDICPKGWQLPRYTGSGSWMYLIKDTYNLISSQGSQGNKHVNNILHKFPFTLTYGGYVYQSSGSTVSQGSGGDLWSIGANSSAGARHLFFGGNYVYPEGDSYKSNGFPVRCVSK